MAVERLDRAVAQPRLAGLHVLLQPDRVLDAALTEHDIEPDRYTLAGLAHPAGGPDVGAGHVHPGDPPADEPAEVLAIARDDLLLRRTFDGREGAPDLAHRR